MKFIKNFLKHSSHVHLPRHRVGTKESLVDIIDRFIDGRMEYPLEWDDFVSWENADPFIESKRMEIGSLERDFLSNNLDRRKQATGVLMELRNSVALMIGIPIRTDRVWDTW